MKGSVASKGMRERRKEKREKRQEIAEKEGNGKRGWASQRDGHPRCLDPKRSAKLPAIPRA